LNKLNGSQGPVPEGKVLHPVTIFQKFEDVADIDTAKFALGQTSRIAFSATGTMLTECACKPIQEIISLLKEFNLPSPDQIGEWGIGSLY